MATPTKIVSLSLVASSFFNQTFGKTPQESASPKTSQITKKYKNWKQQILKTETVRKKQRDP